MQVLASIFGAEGGAMNPAAWVERHARRRPGDPALADGDRVHASWGEFAITTSSLLAIAQVSRSIEYSSGTGCASWDC